MNEKMARQCEQEKSFYDIPDDVFDKNDSIFFNEPESNEPRLMTPPLPMADDEIRIKLTELSETVSKEKLENLYSPDFQELECIEL